MKQYKTFFPITTRAVLSVVALMTVAVFIDADVGIKLIEARQAVSVKGGLIGKTSAGT